MKGSIFAGVAVAALGMMVTAMPASAQPAPAADQAPAAAPAPGARAGRAPRGPQPDDCGLSHFCGIPYKWVPGPKPASPADGPGWMSGDGTKLVNGVAIQTGGTDGWGKSCWGAAMCGWRSTPNTIKVEHKPDMGFTYAYPDVFPAGISGGVTGLGINSKDHVYAFVRSVPGEPEVFEWDENHKFVRSFGANLSGKTHGLTVDAQDNVWIADQYDSTVTKFSPDGKVLMTIGVKGQMGDWDEAKGQRLLWQPLDVAFAPNGDVYIGMGHGNESPNDAAARVLHLDKNGKFLNQWFGNHNGPGKFSMVHGLAVDPKTGNVWLADREEYRIIVDDANGNFVKTIQEPNLVCALYFDPHGQLWMSTGGDGQIVKLDADGKIIGAAGEGSGRGDGQFTESNYMAMDTHGNMYVGDTSLTRVTEMVAHR